VSAEKTQPPPRSELQNLLSLYQNKHFNDAEKLALKLTQRFPYDQFAWKVLAIIHKYNGRMSEALALNKKVIEIDPKDTEAHYNLGNTLKELNKFEDAEESYKKAIKLKPDYAEAHNNLGITLKELTKFEDAEIYFRTVITLRPDYAEAYNNLGNTLKELNKFEDAEESYKKAIKLKPDYAEAHNNLAIMLRELGKLEDAKISYQVAIDLKPDHTHAHYDLSQLKKFNKEDEQFIQMKNLYSNHSLSDEKLCYLNFALAKSSEDLDQLSNSFKYYSQGNKIRKKLLNYNILEDIKQFDLLKKSNLIIKKNSFKNFNLSDKPSPIFIVGMPRSGTTLVEQIVSSHSNVISGGELLYVSQFGNNIATGKSNVNTQILMNFREKYLEKIRILSNDSPVVIDKMTVNFKYIGLICTAFPDAKIVHVKRNSAATCWGIYKRNFLTEGLRFCYNLNDIVKYYELYKNLMQFWQEEYGNQIYNLNYEMLTIDQKDETKKLIQNLGLEWEEKCLMPQDNKRRVSTASSNQIREKIYQGSSQNWKKFKPFLNGILDHLDD
jgi:Flp pilus assembly protein TadD